MTPCLGRPMGHRSHRPDEGSFLRIRTGRRRSQESVAAQACSNALGSAKGSPHIKESNRPFDRRGATNRRGRSPLAPRRLVLRKEKPQLNRLVFSIRSGWDELPFHPTLLAIPPPVDCLFRVLAEIPRGSIGGMGMHQHNPSYDNCRIPHLARYQYFWPDWAEARRPGQGDIPPICQQGYPPRPASGG